LLLKALAESINRVAIRRVALPSAVSRAGAGIISHEGGLWTMENAISSGKSITGVRVSARWPMVVMPKGGELE